MSNNYVCRCYFNHNIFIKKFNVHADFLNDNHFDEVYREILFSKGCRCENDYIVLKAMVKSEVERRYRTDEKSVQRAKLIRKLYSPRHPKIYFLQENFLDCRFLELAAAAKHPGASPMSLMKYLHETEAERVYRVPVFTVEFCKLMIEEIEHFENSDAPKGRPNTMNNYGILLDELGFYPNFIDPLRENYLDPVFKILYPEWTGDKLDSHKAFVVSYKYGDDVDLDDHYDNAEVTLNVSLGKEFENGELCFRGMRQDRDVGLVPSPCEHVIGEGVMHRGQHVHGAMPIESGERYNLIIWLRSSTIRNRCCPMCDSVPDLVEVDGHGGGFTSESLQFCSIL